MQLSARRSLFTTTWWNPFWRKRTGMKEYYGKNPDIHVWHDRKWRVTQMTVSASLFIIWFGAGHGGPKLRAFLHGDDGHH